MKAEEYIRAQREIHWDRSIEPYVKLSYALKAINMAKEEARNELMNGALDGTMVDGDERQLVVPSLPMVTRKFDDGDKVSVIILKKQRK